MNSKIYGYMLAWNSMLAKIEQGRIKTQLSEERDYSRVLASLTEFVEANQHLYQMLLVSLVPFLPIAKKIVKTHAITDLQAFSPEYCDISSEEESKNLSLHTLVNFMKSFPSLARKYYGQCEKYILEHTVPYIKSAVSPAIMDNEIKKIELAQAQMSTQSDEGELTFALYKSTKEIVANYSKN